jgi:hypothetical protein
VESSISNKACLPLGNVDFLEDYCLVILIPWTRSAVEVGLSCVVGQHSFWQAFGARRRQERALEITVVTIRTTCQNNGEPSIFPHTVYRVLYDCAGEDQRQYTRLIGHMEALKLSKVIITSCRMLTKRMQISYVGQERANNYLLQCIVFIL